MSKPTQKGELKDVKVNAISLVAEPANGEKFKIFKSANDDNKQAEPPAPEVISKGAVANIVNAQDKGLRLGRAMDALFKVLGINRWGEPGKDVETSPTKIRAAINDFKNVAEEILIDKDEEIKKAVAEFQKTGRKISGTRLSQLRNIKIMLDTILSELDPSEDDGDTGDLTGEDIAKSVNDAVAPINARITQLEKQNELISFREEIKKAVTDVFQPLNDRLSKVENARGFSNKVLDDSTPIQKNGETFWGQIF